MSFGISLLVKQVCSRLDTKTFSYQFESLTFMLSLKSWNANCLHSKINEIIFSHSSTFSSSDQESEKWKQKERKSSRRELRITCLKWQNSWTFSHKTLQNQQHMREKYRAAAISWRFILLRSAHSRQWFRCVQFSFFSSGLFKKNIFVWTRTWCEATFIWWTFKLS